MSEIKTNSDLVPTARTQGNAVIAAIHGEIDLHTSPELRGVMLQFLENHRPQRLILNLENCPYMDSSAIAVLVETLQKMRKVGGKIVLTSLQPRVKGLLEIARLNAIFVLVKDEEEALKV